MLPKALGHQPTKHNFYPSLNFHFPRTDYNLRIVNIKPRNFELRKNCRFNSQVAVSNIPIHVFVDLLESQMKRNKSALGPVHTYRDIFLIRNFFVPESKISPSTRSLYVQIRSRIRWMRAEGVSRKKKLRIQKYPDTSADGA